MTTTTSNLSPLISAHRTLVFDTSVVLNLLACGAAARFLKMLGTTIVVPRQVVIEIVREPAGLNQKEDSFTALVASGRLLEHRLAGAHLETFIELAAAPSPDGLDDGEAAAIATAEELGCECVLDERKATRIALVRRPQFPPLCTIDLFLEAKDRELFGLAALADLVFLSLSRARMRVPDHHGSWVVDLIGRERAITCPSLSKLMRRARSLEADSCA